MTRKLKFSRKFVTFLVDRVNNSIRTNENLISELDDFGLENNLNQDEKECSKQIVATLENVNAKSRMAIRLFKDGDVEKFLDGIDELSQEHLTTKKFPPINWNDMPGG